MLPPRFAGTSTLHRGSLGLTMPTAEAMQKEEVAAVSELVLATMLTGETAATPLNVTTMETDGDVERLGLGEAEW